MHYTRPTYILVHQGETLLTLDVAVTPPFVIGEDVKPYNPETRESLGWFLVEKISREIPYGFFRDERVAEGSQDVTVHLRKRDTGTTYVEHLLATQALLAP